MKILVLGGSGVIGRAVVKALSPRHEVVVASRSSPAHRVDAREPASLRRLFESVGRVNAIVSVLGDVHWGPLADLTEERFRLGVEGKLMPSVNIALLGQNFLHDGGSVTLTSGVLSEQPIRSGTSATAVNSAIEGFVRGAAVELPRGLRINAVSPGVVRESWDKVGSLVPGFETVPADRVALAYVRSVEGAQTGQVYRVF
jgi:NAD(P)-dependent dehydrogenase (short-subunit alcohol dehydrogenase family)